MISFDTTRINIKHLSTHYVGNKLRDERYILSAKETTVGDDTVDYLLKYFLQSIRVEEQYKFKHTIGLNLNEIYTIVSDIFKSTSNFIAGSQNIAKILYEYSVHPKVKGGELNVVFFDQIVWDGVYTQAIGIFKTEIHSPFLKIKSSNSQFTINHEIGLELKSMERGCLILDTDDSDGYRLLLTNGASKSSDAQYWKDDFLKLEPVNDDYNSTKDLLSLTKNFVTKELGALPDLTRTDQIGILNRSIDYFKEHDNFVKNDFESTVFQSDEIINSFRKFDEAYRVEKDLAISDNFKISSSAVKKQSRIFKSVLKLDRNFDIYIHGDKNLIERGVEVDGRKYYKIYYDEEK